MMKNLIVKHFGGKKIDAVQIANIIFRRLPSHLNRACACLYKVIGVAVLCEVNSEERSSFT